MIATPDPHRGAGRGASLLLGAALLLAGCSAQPAGPPAPELVDLPALEEILADGTPRLVNFWAIWCAPCVAELPDLVRTSQELADEGLEVVAVSLDLPTGLQDVDFDGIAKWAEGRDLDCRVLVLDGEMNEILERLDLPGPLPFTMALDAKGERVDVQEDQAGFERFTAMGRRALEGS